MNREALLAMARTAAAGAYAPYSRFHVGAALAFADGTVLTAANAENASYGLSLCAEAVAVARALADPTRRASPLVAVAVWGGEAPVTPCGRCRQMLCELAGLTGSDPVVWGEGGVEHRLSALLPAAFGPGALKG